MRCKGLILALGEGSGAHLPSERRTGCSGALAQTPRILFTLAVMKWAGIRQVMIGATPDDVAALHRLLDGGAEFGVQISYLILERDSSVENSLNSANRFIADSALLVATAGIFCTNFELSQVWLKSASSVVSFRMRSGALDEDESRPGLLLIGKSALVKLQRQLADSGNSSTNVDQLRRSCMSRLKYSDISLTDRSVCINFNKTNEIDTSKISEAEILELLHADPSKDT